MDNVLFGCLPLYCPRIALPGQPRTYTASPSTTAAATTATTLTLMGRLDTLSQSYLHSRPPNNNRQQRSHGIHSWAHHPLLPPHHRPFAQSLRRGCPRHRPRPACWPGCAHRCPSPAELPCVPPPSSSGCASCPGSSSADRTPLALAHPAPR